MSNMTQTEKNKQASDRVNAIQTSIPGTEEFKQTMGFMTFDTGPTIMNYSPANHALLMEIKGMLKELLNRVPKRVCSICGYLVGSAECLMAHQLGRQ